MSIIRIKGRPDPIRLPYERAKKIKQRKFGDDTVIPAVPKASPSDLIDLGDEWSGTYGQIVAIELGDKPRPILSVIEEPEITPEQRLKNREYLREIGERLGILSNKMSVGKLQLSRKAINEYQKKFGVTYEIPEGAKIIEDDN